ncbi:MAG TPA: hypothetical protein DIW77_20545 [Chromatiaceae bacterium]|nr:hypothetical protein [Chromatiaceae bacterium]
MLFDDFQDFLQIKEAYWLAILQFKPECDPLLVNERGEIFVENGIDASFLANVPVLLLGRIRVSDVPR